MIGLVCLFKLKIFDSNEKHLNHICPSDFFVEVVVVAIVLVVLSIIILIIMSMKHCANRSEPSSKRGGFL